MIPDPVVPDDEQLPQEPRSDPEATVDALERRIERREGKVETSEGPPAPADGTDPAAEPPD